MRRTSMPSDSSIPRRRTRASRSRPGIPTSVSTSSSCRWPGRSGSRTAAWWAARSRSRVRRIICRCWPSFGRPDQTARVILARLTIRTRIAPSPTGDPHVGTAYVALFNYALARRSGGQFLLRIEDTDRQRSHPASERMIFEALRWLGLTWDEGPDVGGPCGPYRQSERSGAYDAAAARLVASGTAYACVCDPAELDARRRDAEARGEPFRYDGRCRDLGATPRIPGAGPALRLRLPAGEIEFMDGVYGRVRITPARYGDPVRRRSDGSPNYNFAAAVDDASMAITDVLRGEDHLTNTAIQISLHRALGREAPRYAHLPMILGGDGARLSKRHGAA